MRFKVSSEEAGKRIDLCLVKRFSTFSRTKIQSMIRMGIVRLNGSAVKTNAVLQNGDQVEIDLPKKNSGQKNHLVEEKVPLDIRYEDEHLLIVNKPAGMLVHPTPHQREGTLVNALLGYCRLSGGASRKAGLRKIAAQDQDFRPGIVHRLDRDTSGLLIVAKNDRIHSQLAKMIEKRKVKKTYLALVEGKVRPKKGVIESPLLKVRDEHHAVRVKVMSGKEARWSITQYEVVEYPDDRFTLVRINLITGRTHQIRAHFQSIGHPVVGDQLYGLKKDTDLPTLTRQFLHAHELEFLHPVTRKSIKVTAELPEELEGFLLSQRHCEH